MRTSDIVGLVLIGVLICATIWIGSCSDSPEDHKPLETSRFTMIQRMEQFPGSTLSYQLLEDKHTHEEWVCFWGIREPSCQKTGVIFNGEK